MTKIYNAVDDPPMPPEVAQELVTGLSAYLNENPDFPTNRRLIFALVVIPTDLKPEERFALLLQSNSPEEMELLAHTMAEASQCCSEASGLVVGHS